MKLFIKLILTVIVLAVALPFFMFGPDGGPLLHWKDVKKPDIHIPELPDMSKAVALGEKLTAPVKSAVKELMDDGGNSLNQLLNENRKESITTYIWKDEKGVTHFSDQVPPDGVSYKASTYIPKKAVKSVSKTNNRTKKEPKKEGAILNGDISLKNIYSVEGVQKLVKDAENVKKLVEDRYNNFDKTLNE